MEGKVFLACWAVCVLTCMAAVVKEEQVVSCNTPCDMMRLTCPRQHRMAVREVLFSVTARSASATEPCPLTHTCGTETVCCHQSAVQDCVFSYSPSHLEAVHRNCSGTRTCAVKTERTQEESVACPFFRPDETVSHTVMDYVCINESAIVDICNVRETQIVGRTLFSMLDTGKWRNPRGGAVCRCTAQSVRWPTTNTIAVFVVDVRLNMIRQSHCSKADVMLKSGSVTRHLDCESSRDPRQAFPFIALLNNSNVATVELVLHKKMPEFVWIGFESNEVEDIRLTCGLQGYVPVLDDENEKSQGSKAEKQGYVKEKAGSMSAGAIAGAVVGVVLICGVIVALIIGFLFYRRKQGQSKTDDYSDPHDTLDDIDVYYSTPELNAAQTNHNTSNQKTGNGAGNNKATSRTTVQGEGDTEEGEVYVTAAVVRERKRQSTKKMVRILSIPDIASDVTEYYASPWDIRDKRRLELEVGGREKDDVTDEDHPPQLPPPLPSPNACSEEDDYDMLDRHRRESNDTAHEQSYDRIPVLPPRHTQNHVQNGSNDDVDDDDDDDGDDEKYVTSEFTADDRPEPVGCIENFAYEDGDDFVN